MIYEYAVDPALCTDWKDLRDLVFSFGKEQGRLISDIPKNEWVRSALKAIKKSNPPPVHRKRLKTFLISLSKKALYVRTHTINSNPEWIQNAKESHQRWPFRAILTSIEYDGNEDFILKNDIDLPDHALWKLGPSKTINRKSLDMINEIKPLLENARQVMLIDRNFCLVNENGYPMPRYKSVLLEILTTLKNKRYGPAVRKVVYHVGDKLSLNELKRQCELYLKSKIPNEMILQFVIWPWDELHDRYVLTDIGGVDFGQGLDEWTGHGPEKVKLSRISDEDYREWWSKCHMKSVPTEKSDNCESFVIN